jgi:glyoxylase I family protein
MNIVGLHHIAIISGDYEKSKRFYTQVLPFQIISEIYRAERDSYKLDLSIGDGTQIELFSFPDAPPRPSYPEARGLRHLALTVADLDQEVTKLKEKGVLVEDIRIDPVTGKRFTFFADPDGLPIEFYEL